MRSTTWEQYQYWFYRYYLFGLQRLVFCGRHAYWVALILLTTVNVSVFFGLLLTLKFILSHRVFIHLIGLPEIAAGIISIPIFLVANHMIFKNRCEKILKKYEKEDAFSRKFGVFVASMFFCATVAFPVLTGLFLNKLGLAG